LGTLIVQLEILLGTFCTTIIFSEFLSFTPVKRLLLTLKAVLLEICKLLEGTILLLAVGVRGGYSETSAGPKILSEIILVCSHMLLLELHSEIIVPIIRAVGNPTTDGLLREQLRPVLKVMPLVCVPMRSSRVVASHCFCSQGCLGTTEAMVYSRRTRLVH
jgi:hypothetical protein